jgi:hypothetical protein
VKGLSDRAARGTRRDRRAGGGPGRRCPDDPRGQLASARRGRARRPRGREAAADRDRGSRRALPPLTVALRPARDRRRRRPRHPQGRVGLAPRGLLLGDADAARGLARRVRPAARPRWSSGSARRWERTGATWEDGKPRPWERYVLVQNELDNLPPGTLKSTIAMVCANAWIWLHGSRRSRSARRPASMPTSPATRTRRATSCAAPGTARRSRSRGTPATTSSDPRMPRSRRRPRTSGSTEEGRRLGLEDDRGRPALLAHDPARLHRPARRRHLRRRSRRRRPCVERGCARAAAEPLHARDREPRQRRAPHDPQGDAAASCTARTSAGTCSRSRAGRRRTRRGGCGSACRPSSGFSPRMLHVKPCGARSIRARRRARRCTRALARRAGRQA